MQKVLALGLHDGFRREYTPSADALALNAEEVYSLL